MTPISAAKNQFPRPETFHHLIWILGALTDYEKMESFHRGRVGCDLSGMQRLVAALGQPQLRVPCVHVTGSKGKGSTATMISALLRSAGLRCGLYTSPHLVHLNERIAVDGKPLDETPFLKAADGVLEAMRRDRTLRPTFFEFITGTAMIAFHRAEIDCAIYEVGLGGTHDATNVIQPEVTVITSVDLEHVPRLGTTREEIAREKAGIVKPGVPLVTLLEEGSGPRLVVDEIVAARLSPLLAPGRGLDLRREDEGFVLDLAGGGTTRFVPPRPIAVQSRNAALALAACSLLRTGGRLSGAFQRACDAGVLATLGLPGRFEVLHHEPTVVIDGAHNPASLGFTVDEALKLADGGELVILFGLAADKDLAGCLDVLLASGASLIFTPYESPRSLSPDHLQRGAGGRGSVVGSVREGLEKARGIADPSGVVLVTGSFYCAGEAKAILQEGSNGARGADY